MGQIWQMEMLLMMLLTVAVSAACVGPDAPQL